MKKRKLLALSMALMTIFTVNLGCISKVEAGGPSEVSTESGVLPSEDKVKEKIAEVAENLERLVGFAERMYKFYDDKGRGCFIDTDGEREAAQLKVMQAQAWELCKWASMMNFLKIRGDDRSFLRCPGNLQGLYCQLEVLTAPSTVVDGSGFARDDYKLDEWARSDEDEDAVEYDNRLRRIDSRGERLKNRVDNLKKLLGIAKWYLS